MRQAISSRCPGIARATGRVGNDKLMARTGGIKGHSKGHSAHRWKGGRTAQATIAMDVIHINQVGILLSDQQKVSGGVNQYLGGIGIGSAQRPGGSGNRMQRPLVINMEASHVGRLRARVGCIQDIEQAIAVAQADGTCSTGGEYSRQGEMPIVDIDHGDLIASGIHGKQPRSLVMCEDE